MEKNIEENVITGFKFIVINYNGSRDTMNCVDSIMIASKAHSDVTVYIVDNCSDVDDYEELVQYSEGKADVVLVRLKENVGYFPAFKYIIERFRDVVVMPQSIVVLCNNDLIFDESFIEIYKSKKYSSDTFIVSPSVVTPGGIYQNPHVKNRFSIFRRLQLKFYFYNYSVAHLLTLISTLKKAEGKRVKEGSQFIYAGIGACYIVRPSFFEKIMNVDDRTFLGGEELLLAIQLLAHGGKNYYDSDLLVKHIEGATFKKMSSKWRYEQSKSSYQIYRDFL